MSRASTGDVHRDSDCGCEVLAVAPDLTENDKAILVELLRETINRDRFLMSPSPGTSHLPPPLVPVGDPPRPHRRRDKTEPTFPPLASMNLHRPHLSGRPSC